MRHTSVRLDPDLRQRLEQIAKKKNLSFTQVLALAAHRFAIEEETGLAVISIAAELKSEILAAAAQARAALIEATYAERDSTRMFLEQLIPVLTQVPIPPTSASGSTSASGASPLKIK